MIPAFAHVGAARAFANGVQAECAHNAFQILIIFSAEKANLQPVRTRMRVGRRHGHAGGGTAGQNVERCGHLRVNLE